MRDDVKKSSIKMPDNHHVKSLAIMPLCFAMNGALHNKRAWKKIFEVSVCG